MNLKKVEKSNNSNNNSTYYKIRYENSFLNMKKLNLFRVTNKKTSSHKDLSKDSSFSLCSNSSASGDGTILRIVSQKEVVSNILSFKQLFHWAKIHLNFVLILISIYFRKK